MIVHSTIGAVVLTADAFIAYAVEKVYAVHHHLDKGQLILAVAALAVTALVLVWAIRAGRREAGRQQPVQQAPRRYGSLR